MARVSFISLAAAAAALSLCAVPAIAAEVDGCTHFTWDVSHELAVMKQMPQAATASAKPGAEAPLLQVDKLYNLKLLPQGTVTYAAKPAKPTLDDSAQGGLIRFHVRQAGAYRISITSGHWVDIVDGAQLVKSRDFQGARGCDKPHKIVEFDLPGDRDLTLQFSGSTDSSVLMSITPVSAPAAH